tara:strand:- start:262 stop:1104 length:843 start_codon:yes stop_codon:yes gene_type:complete
MKSWHLKNKSAGFTLIEMLVVAPIVILLIGTIIYAIVQLTGDALSERASAELINDVHSSLDRIESDTKVSGAFLATNNMPLTSPQGSDDSTANFTSVTAGDDALILNTFVTDANPNDPNRSLVYLANMPNSCASANLEQNQVMTMNTVYFTKVNASDVNELWRRTLAVSGYTSRDCSGVTPWQRPSCTPGLSGTMCQAQDELLLSGVREFSIDYFNAASDTSPSANAQNSNTTTRQTAMDLTDTIQVTLKAESTSAGRDIAQQGTIRVTRVGALITYATP